MTQRHFPDRVDWPIQPRKVTSVELERIVTRRVESRERRRDITMDFSEEDRARLGTLENTGPIPFYARPPRFGGCEIYSADVAMHLYASNNINAIDVFSGTKDNKWALHMFVMADTTDKGVVIIDPTIRQIFHDYPKKVFIGTPQELRELMASHGGPDAPVLNSQLIPHPRVRDYYEHPYVETTGIMDLRANQFNDWWKGWQGLGEFTPQLRESDAFIAWGEPKDTHASRLAERRTPNKFER